MQFACGVVIRCKACKIQKTGLAAAGRVPSLDVAELRLAHWKESGLNIDGHTLGLATFVDNLFAIGRSPESAIHILDDCAHFLLSRWGLKIGADSREDLPCHGYQHPVDQNSLWQRKATMRVLGHWLDNDGSVRIALKSSSIP